MLRVAENTHEWIGFVGGPFDGHSQRREHPYDRLPVNLVWLVCQDTFAQLESHLQPKHDQPNHASLTSVALYRLDPTGSPEVYRFSGAISASKFGEMLGGVDKTDRA